MQDLAARMHASFKDLVLPLWNIQTLYYCVYERVSVFLSKGVSA